MGFLDRVKQGVRDLNAPSQSRPPVDLGPGASSVEEIATLAQWAERARAIVAAAPTPTKAKVVAVADDGQRVAAVPIVALHLTADGVDVHATLPVTGAVRRVSPGKKVNVHVAPDDPTAVALAEGSPGRAIVQYSEGVSASEGIDILPSKFLASARIENVPMTIRPRLADGGFGELSEQNPMLRREAGLLVGVGTEIPVVLDHATGQVRGIDVEALKDEFEPRYAEARAAEKERGKRGLGFAIGAIKEGLQDLKAPSDGPAPEVIEGVTADQWLQARKALRTTGGPPEIREHTVKAYGVPGGTWEAVDAAWSARATDDPDLAARLAQADGR